MSNVIINLDSIQSARLYSLVSKELQKIDRNKKKAKEAENMAEYNFQCQLQDEWTEISKAFQTGWHSANTKSAKK